MSTLTAAARSDVSHGADLVVIEPIEAYALRGILEYEGLRVKWCPVTTTGDLRHLLGRADSPARHVVICCHGDERGIVLEGVGSWPRSWPEGDEGPADRLTPELVLRHARLQGRVVVATGCDTGAPAMAGAFLDAGCAAYDAPYGYPQSALLFMHRLYHELAAGAALEGAVAAAAAQDADSRMFKLWSPTDPSV